MRILLVNDYGSRLGGAEEYFFMLAAALRERDHQVTTVSSDHRRDSRPWETDFQIRSSGSVKNIDSLFNPIAYLQFRKIVSKVKPECIHFHNVFYALSPSVLYATAGCRSIVTLHDYFAICLEDKTDSFAVACTSSFADCSACQRRGSGSRLAVMRRVRAQKGLLRMDCLVAPSEYLANEYRRNNLSNVAVLPHPVVAPKTQLLSEMSSDSESQDIKSQTRVGQNFHLLFVGRLASQKGAEVAIRAMAIAAAENANLRLDLAGDGPERRALEALSRELGLQDRVYFHGWCDEKTRERLYQRAQVLLQPAVWPEVAGLTALEAAVRGIPVLASRIGALPETVKDGVSGYLVSPPGDPAALAEKILVLAADPELCSSLGKGARKMCIRRTLSAHLDALEEIYRP